MPRREALAEPGAASEGEISEYEFLVFSPCWRPQQTPSTPTTTPSQASRPPGPEKEGRGTATILLGLGPLSACLQPGSGSSVTTGR